MEQANVNGGVVTRQRVHRSEEEILKHLADQEEGEFSVKEYCEMMEINEQTFNSWVKKYRGREEEKGFAHVQIIPSSPKQELFAEVNGIRLYKEVSAEFLKALL